MSCNDHLLDIGCGWGGLAKYFSIHYGCPITAVNISNEQLRYARELCRGLRVDFQECDYRSIKGHYDKIVSVGMFKHVGNKNYRTFMNVVSKSMRDDGIFLLQTIGKNVTKYYNDPWITSYIFPKAIIPSMRQIAKSVESIFIIEDVHNIGPHYDKTLMAWNEKFQKNWRYISEIYENSFKRMWEYYLLSCACAFIARYIQLWQLVMTIHKRLLAQPVRQS